MAFFTSFLVLVALGAHFLAKYTFHLYDITPIDRFTHGLSGMALTAIVLNLYLTRNRKYYYTISIAVSWVPFVLWEVYEWIYATYSGPSGFIQTEPWDMVIDLWIDSLGALAICFSTMNLQRAKKQHYIDSVKGVCWWGGGH